jgi:hypothetical protein
MELSKKAFEIIKTNSKLRNEIISIGIPILLPNGKSLLRGNEIKIPPFHGDNELDITPANIEMWTHDGWIDLRETNMKVWLERINKLIEETNQIPSSDTSSMYVRTKKYWNNFETIDIGKVVGWLFIKEEKGERMKA